MPMPSGIIFPTHVYGTLSDKYGTNITAYNDATKGNTTGFPPGSGLQLGQFGILFDGSQVKMCKANGTINASDFVSPAAVANDYTVVQTPATINTQFLLGVNDRVGAQLVANDFAWMSIYGLTTANVAAGVAAGSMLTSSAVAGRAMAGAAGVSLQGNVICPVATTVAGANSAIIR
jgi:hypothetical protein